MHSALFLDFLAGNQTYHCTPWGMPTRNIFGWQKPCYLLGEGYAKTFAELMETTDWDSYGTGRYEKCANCMAHCGYEPTAATATLAHPLQGILAELARSAHRGADGAGNRARPAAPGRIRVLRASAAEAIGDPRGRGRSPEPRTRRARRNAATAIAVSSAGAHQRRDLPRIARDALQRRGKIDRDRRA